MTYTDFKTLFHVEDHLRKDQVGILDEYVKTKMRAGKKDWTEIEPALSRFLDLEYADSGCFFGLLYLACREKLRPAKKRKAAPRKVKVVSPPKALLEAIAVLRSELAVHALPPLSVEDADLLKDLLARIGRVEEKALPPDVGEDALTKLLLYIGYLLLLEQADRVNAVGGVLPALTEEDLLLAARLFSFLGFEKAGSGAKATPQACKSLAGKLGERYTMQMQKICDAGFALQPSFDETEGVFTLCYEPAA